MATCPFCSKSGLCACDTCRDGDLPCLWCKRRLSEYVPEPKAEPAEPPPTEYVPW